MDNGEDSYHDSTSVFGLQRIGVRIATCVVMEISVIHVALENSVAGVCDGFQTFAMNIATTTFVRYKSNSCWRNFYK